MISTRKFFEALIGIERSTGWGVSGGGSKMINVQRHELTYPVNVRREKTSKLINSLHAQPACFLTLMTDISVERICA